MAHVANIPNSGLNPWGRVRSFFAGLKKAHVQAAEFDRTFSELQRLSDRELNDIGIRRCDIADISRKHVYCT